MDNHLQINLITRCPKSDLELEISVIRLVISSDKEYT